MVTLEQKIDLVMQFCVAKDTKEKNRLKDEIAAALSEPSDTPKTTPTSISYDNDELMTNIIDDLFKELGCPCHLKGYDQAAYATKLCIHDREYVNNITYGLYVDVAKAFNTTRSRTERAIRHLVECAWNRHDIEDAYRIFGNTIDLNRGKPTNSQFLASCAKIVERRMREKM